MQRLPLLIVLFSLGTLQCGGEDHDLPPGWAGAHSLPVDQSGCTGSDVAP